METKIESIMLWGHSLAEYQQMFALTEEDLQKRYLIAPQGRPVLPVKCINVGKGNRL